MMRGGYGKQSKPITKGTLKRVARLFKPYKFQVGTTICAVIASALLGLLPFYYLQKIVDVGLARHDLPITAHYSLLTIVITLVASLLMLVYGYLSVVVGQHIMRDLRNQLFTHLQAMSLRFFSSTRIGEIQTRLISDVSGVQNVVSGTVADALSNVTTVISSLIAI